MDFDIDLYIELNLNGLSYGRWGKTDLEKGPVDLFPVEPTDETYRTKKRVGHLTYSLSFFMRKMGLEPTREYTHKILSLARLPIPTLPRTIDCHAFACLIDKT